MNEFRRKGVMRIFTLCPSCDFRREAGWFGDMQRKGEAASLIELAGYAHFLAEVLHDFVSDGKP